MDETLFEIFPFSCDSWHEDQLGVVSMKKQWLYMGLRISNQGQVTIENSMILYKHLWLLFVTITSV